jgi:hypothetical protein
MEKYDGYIIDYAGLIIVGLTAPAFLIAGKYLAGFWASTTALWLYLYIKKSNQVHVLQKMREEETK